MRERPILFSAPMVRAILEGRKTLTRRVVKPQPSANHKWLGWCLSSTHQADEGKVTWVEGDHPHAMNPLYVRCPYGKPGDRLWVREAWSTHAMFDLLAPREIAARSVHYWVDGDVQTGKRRPGMFMPRWASRILLEVTEVRVERLQDISEADAVAEGAECIEVGGETGVALSEWSHREGFIKLWKSINGPDSWALNPWVWVVSFKRIEGATHDRD